MSNPGSGHYANGNDPVKAPNSQKSVVYNITASETNPNPHNHINGTQSQILTRYAISELCKGWPVTAYVFTTWSGGLSIDEFVQVSIEGRANGDFIMHRENGTLVELNEDQGRAVGKMKTTISQSFIMDGVTFDVECDCRFIFCCRIENNEWKVQWYKVIYEKSWIQPADGKSLPKFDEADLRRYPEGYNYLAVAQKMIGHQDSDGSADYEQRGAFPEE